MARAKAVALSLVFGVAATALVQGVAGAAEREWCNGRPAFDQGEDRGYFIWRDGDRWHVRWTTHGATRRFSGQVVAEGGKLDSLKRIDVEAERRIIAPGRPARVVVGPHGRRRVAPGRAPVVSTRREDRIEKDGDSRIHWVSRTDADIDGFDFTAGDRVRSLRFRCEIDGKSRPLEVSLGRDNRRPALNPFVVTLK